MRARFPWPLRASALAAALACVSAAAAPLHAQCSWTELVWHEPTTVSTSPAFYSFYQTLGFWTAIAVESPATADWDISAWRETGPYPACVSSMLAGSARGSGVDFVVGDFNFDTVGVHYIEVNRYSGTGDAKLQWNPTDGMLAVNAAYETAPFGVSPHVYDVLLEAGLEYVFALTHTGPGEPHLLLFRNETDGLCWKGRSAAEFDLTADGAHAYTAPTSGFYGVVIVNDNGQTGDARVRVYACTPPKPLAHLAPVGVGLADDYYFVDPTSSRWTAVALRQDPTATVQVHGSDPGTPNGICLADPLASSSPSSGQIAVLAGDFSTATPVRRYVGTYYPHDLTPPAGVLQWDAGQGWLPENGSLVQRAMGAADLVRIWSTALQAGETYRLTFEPSGASLRLWVFLGPGGESWFDRGDAMAGAVSSVDFVAPASGVYGLAVVHEDANPGTFRLGVGRCTPPFTLMPDVGLPSSLAANYASFAMDVPYWTVVGVRGTEPSDDWDVSVRGTTPASFPTCSDPELASSTQIPPVADFVVADFNHLSAGTCRAWLHAYPGEATGIACIQWNRTEGVLDVDAPMVAHATAPLDFLQAWDVYLEAATEYTFRFNSVGRHLMLFRNPGSGAYWAPRSSAVLDHVGAGFGQVSYTAPTSDFYGVVVVTDDGTTGAYELSVHRGPVDVAESPPPATGLMGVRPNPARSAACVRFALQEPATVSFQVHDLAGRRLATVPARAYGAGRWSVTWDGRGDDGARAAPGVYLVRMRAGGRVVGTERFTLLE